jgi:hypothetical protein
MPSSNVYDRSHAQQQQQLYTRHHAMFTTAAANGDSERLKADAAEPPVKAGRQPPQHRQYLVSFREGATKPSDLFGSLKKVGKSLLMGSGGHHGEEEGEEEGGGGGGGKPKCQCRHHLKKYREQSKLEEQRYTRAILNANNMFKGEYG